jgi:MFS family permease
MMLRVTRVGHTAWASPSFRLLLAGQFVSEAGSTVSAIVLPLVAVSVLHASTLAVSALTAVSTGTVVLLGLPAGVVTDRRRRRPILITADVVRAAAMGTIALLAATGSLDIRSLLVLATVAGSATVFFEVAYQSYLPAVVATPALVDANAKLEASSSTAWVIGPGLGGALLRVLGAAGAVAFDAVSYVVSFVSLAAIRAKEPPVTPNREPNKTRYRAELMSGIRFVFTHRHIRPIAVTSTMINLFASMSTAVLVVYLVRDLRLTPWQVGLLFSAISIGGLVIALLASRIAARLGQQRTIWLSIAITAPFGLLVPLARPGWLSILVVVSILITQAGSTLYNIAQVALRQRICPTDMLGRMTASIRWLAGTAAPVGALTGGAIADATNLRSTLYIAACGYIATAILLIRSPIRGDAPDASH